MLASKYMFPLIFPLLIVLMDICACYIVYSICKCLSHYLFPSEIYWWTAWCFIHVFTFLLFKQLQGSIKILKINYTHVHAFQYPCRRLKYFSYMPTCILTLSGVLSPLVATSGLGTPDVIRMAYMCKSWLTNQWSFLHVSVYQGKLWIIKIQRNTLDN